VEELSKGAPIQCHLCYKDDFCQKHEVEEDEVASGGGGGDSIPDGWCHDYHNEGNTIYFCSKDHRDLWRRAVHLSWQAVALLKEFARSLKNTNH